MDLKNTCSVHLRLICERQHQDKIFELLRIKSVSDEYKIFIDPNVVFLHYYNWEPVWFSYSNMLRAFDFYMLCKGEFDILPLLEFAKDNSGLNFIFKSEIHQTGINIHEVKTSLLRKGHYEENTITDSKLVKGYLNNFSQFIRIGAF